MKNTLKLTVSDIAVIGIMVATLVGGKMALSFLPNVEVVTLLIILYTLCFGKKVIYAIFAFICIETFLYGFHLWVIMYLYTWPLLALITYVCRKFALNPTEIVSNWKNEFNSYEKFKEWLSE